MDRSFGPMRSRGGIPVVAGNKVYQFGYYGAGEEVEESLTCLDLESGQMLWDKRRKDFISDIVYDRYGVGSACIDPETGNIFFQTSPGMLMDIPRMVPCYGNDH